MYIKEICLKNFRNYTEAKISLSDKTNIIYGLNAQGKTNILEAMYLFSTGRSHRKASVSEFIKQGENFCEINLDFESYNRSFEGNLRIFEDKKKFLKINGAEIKKISEISNYINVVMFAPEDLFIIKGFPSERRRFCDMAISQVKPVYINLLNNYIKTISERNSLLKEISRSGRGEEMLDVWDETLADLSSKIAFYRYEFIEKIKSYLYEIYNEISMENVKMKYICSFCEDFKDISDLKKKALEKLFISRKRDIDLGATTSGIHKDDYLFFIDKKEVRKFASQGQQRSLILSLKLAQAEYINEIKNDYPIILLDDIASELDEKRRSYLKGRIKDKQVIITCTDKEESIALKDRVKYFLVSNGSVTED